MNLKSAVAIPLAVIAIRATAFAFPASADGKLTVLLFDYTGLSPAVLQNVESATGVLLAPAGIRVQWVLCRARWISDTPEPCRAPLITVRVLVRIIDHCIGRHDQRGDPLGAAVIKSHYATLYAREIRDWSDGHGVDVHIVMAYAAAHEIGHLLLGPQHGKAGIMQSPWDKPPRGTCPDSG